ncbi:MAG: ROK family transcriptional regulator [Caldilineaceae bacterium]
MIATSQKATREQTKLHNKRLILKIVYNQGLISRADLARMTSLTATTVSAAVGELLAEGLVEEVGSISTERGKPPTLIQLVKDANFALALDLSRKVIRGGILNLRGESKRQHNISLHDRMGDQAVEVIYEMIDALLVDAPQPILGIGIGAPGIIDSQRGYVQRAVNLSWLNLPLRDLLKKRYNLAASVVNDNQAALLAEYHFGRYRNQEHLVVIRLGNGIGAGMVLNRQLLHSYGVGEIGHVTVVENGSVCSCGNVGCLETVASSRAIVKQAQSIALHNSNSTLAPMLHEPGGITMEAVLEAFAAGDPTLRPLVENVGHYLGIAIANLIGVLGLTKILLAGSVAQIGQPLLEIVRQEVCQRSLTARLNPPTIDLVDVRPDISDTILLGAATALFADELGLF